MRYITLLAYALVVTYATAEQMHEGLPFQSRHGLSLVVTALLNVTMILSIREDRQARASC